MTLTAEQRAELRRLEREATPGPWKARLETFHSDGCEMRSRRFVMPVPSEGFGSNWPLDTEHGQRADANYQLVEAMRSALPTLLDAADRADALASLLSEALAYLAEHPSEHDPRRAEKAKLCDRIAAVLK